MSVDPMASERSWLTPYNFVQNNPVLRIDPDGRLDDWYENQNGETQWFATSSEEFSDSEGNSWTNAGKEAVTFNGETLKTYRQKGNEIDGYSFMTAEFGAVSGRASDDGSFDYSKERQAQKDKGPLPEGTYFLNPEEVQSFEDLSLLNQVYSSTGLGGAFKGGTYAWGNERVWLTPSEVKVFDPATGEIVIRNNFSIHGGRVPGSAGCIDLHGNADVFFNHLRDASRFKSKRIPVIVNY